MSALWRWTIYFLFYASGFDLWIQDRSCAEFTLASSLLMSNSKNQADIYYSGSFHLFFLRSTSWVQHHTSGCSTILRPTEFRGRSVIQFRRLIVDSKWHLWDAPIKQFFLLLRTARYFQHIFFSFHLYSWLFFWKTLAAFLWSTVQTRRRQKKVSLTWALWQPPGSSLRVLSSYSYLNILLVWLWKSTKVRGPTVPSIFVKSLHLWESQRKIFSAGVSVQKLIFPFFALSLFGSGARLGMSSPVTRSGAGESYDKWCSLLTPSLGYLWLINWSEKETCWRSGRRRRQAWAALPRCGPQASGATWTGEAAVAVSVCFLFPVVSEWNKPFKGNGRRKTSVKPACTFPHTHKK